MLRYYASFKVRKVDLLFYKIITFLQKKKKKKITACIGLQVEQILYIYICHICYIYVIYIQFCEWGLLFAVPFFFVISKSSSFLWWKNFAALYFYLYELKKWFPRFLKSCFKLEILLFLYFVVSFLVDMFN